MTPQANKTVNWDGIEVCHESESTSEGETHNVCVGRQGEFSSLACALDTGWYGEDDGDGERISKSDMRLLEEIETAYTEAGLY